MLAARLVHIAIYLQMKKNKELIDIELPTFKFPLKVCKYTCIKGVIFNLQSNVDSCPRCKNVPSYCQLALITTLEAVKATCQYRANFNP